MTTYYDAVIVGGGFGGISELYQLRKAGLKVHGYERGTTIGGVWHHNRYPGARVDSESPLYQLWLEETCKDWTFRERFASGPELQEYFAYAETKLHVCKDYSFETNVAAAHWDGQQKIWRIRTEGKDTGDVVAKYLVLCTGFALKKNYPRIEGLDNFQGKAFHTADWPREGIDLANKRVAVIGTGASGVQVVQEIGSIVKQLTVFQRTPNTAIPMRQYNLEAKQQEDKVDKLPSLFERLKRESLSGFTYNRDKRFASECTDQEIQAQFDKCWNEGGFRFWEGNFDDLLTNAELNKLAYNYWREKVLQRVHDPRKQALLAPEKQLHPIFAKRPSLEQRYYEVFNQDNVDIVDLRQTPVVEVTESGLRTTEAEYEFDVIVYATGFDAVTGGFLQIDLRGANGIALKDKWANGTFTYLGMSISEFPNLFFMYGPQGPSAFCNGPTCCSIQSEWISRTILQCEKDKRSSIVATEEAQQKWRNYINDGANRTLLPLADSWYMGVGREGIKTKECLMYVYGTNRYFEDLEREISEGYPNFVIA